MIQADKDALLNTARTAYQTVFDFISAMTIDVPPDTTLQGQIDALHSQAVTMQAQITAQATEIDNLKISNASLQSKIDMVRAAIG